MLNFAVKYKKRVDQNQILPKVSWHREKTQQLDSVKSTLTFKTEEKNKLSDSAKSTLVSKTE